MPFKRRLRLLFVASEHEAWTRDAVGVAQRIGATRLEARAAMLHAPAAFDWADLILTLDAAARDGLPALPVRVQVRHLDLAGAADAQERDVLVESRIQGILGGLKLLARSG